MKNFFSKISLKVKVAFLTAMAFLFDQTFMLKAQDISDPTGSIMSNTTSRLAGLVPSIMNVLKIGVLIGGGIALLLVVFNILSGERDAAKKAGWWLVGLLIGFVALSVLANTAQSLANSGTGA